MDKKRQWHVYYFIVAALGIIFLQQMWALNQKIEVIPYSQ